jgi:hypothetical protein
VSNLIKSVDFNYYVEGYNVKTGDNCSELPISVAAGYYDYENYFYYLFLRNCYKNWGSSDIGIFVESHHNEILKELGLEIIPHYCEDHQQLISTLQEQIDRGIPVVLPVIYSSLFYYHHHYLDLDSEHTILVSSYYTEKPLFGIIDCNIVEHGLAKPNEIYTLYKLYLSHSLLTEIWDKSNPIFQATAPHFHQRLFTVTKVSAPKITSYLDLVQYYLRNCPPEKSVFTQIITNFNDTQEIASRFRKSIDGIFENLRDYFCNNLKVLFDAFEKALLQKREDEEKIRLYQDFKRKYLHSRDITLSKLYLTALKGQYLSGAQQDKLLETAAEMDRQLWALINQLFE